jgi:hypothetical protein
MVCIMNSLLSRRPRGLYLFFWPSPVTGFSGNMLMQEFLACFRSFDNVPSTQVGDSPGQWITIWCSTCTFSADPWFWVRLRCSHSLCNANGSSPILHEDSSCTGIKVIQVIERPAKQTQPAGNQTSWHQKCQTDPLVIVRALEQPQILMLVFHHFMIIFLIGAPTVSELAQM